MELLPAILDVVQIAHDLAFPHEEPVTKSDGGGASPVVILAGIVATLAAVAGLVWLKKRAEGGAENKTQEDL